MPSSLFSSRLHHFVGWELRHNANPTWEIGYRRGSNPSPAPAGVAVADGSFHCHLFLNLLSLRAFKKLHQRGVELSCLFELGNVATFLDDQELRTGNLFLEPLAKRS